MAHVGLWTRIDVRNNDNSITQWDLDDCGRLKNPPRRQRRRFEVGTDNIRRPVAYQSHTNNHTRPSVHNHWNDRANVDQTPTDYDQWSGSTQEDDQWTSSTQEDDQWTGGPPEVLETYDVDFPMSYLMDEQYLEEDAYFGGNELLW